MTKQEQIEDFAEAIICAAITANAKIDDKVAIHLKEFTENLYNAGYRKVPDGAVIIPAEGRDGEMKAYNEERAEFEKEIERLKIQLEQANAGAIKDFAEKLTDIFYGYDGWHNLQKEINELLKEYEK